MHFPVHPCPVYLGLALVDDLCKLSGWSCFFFSFFFFKRSAMGQTPSLLHHSGALGIRLHNMSVFHNSPHVRLHGANNSCSVFKSSLMSLHVFRKEGQEIGSHGCVRNASQALLSQTYVMQSNVMLCKQIPKAILSWGIPETPYTFFTPVTLHQYWSPMLQID